MGPDIIRGGIRMSVIAAAAVPHPPIILPEVGQGEEKKIQKTADAYRAVMQRSQTCVFLP